MRMSQAHDPRKNCCLGNLIFHRTLSHGTSGIKACGKGIKMNRILVMWRVKKDLLLSRLLLPVTLLSQLITHDGYPSQTALRLKCSIKGVRQPWKNKWVCFWPPPEKTLYQCMYLNNKLVSINYPKITDIMESSAMPLVITHRTQNWLHFQHFWQYWSPGGVLYKNINVFSTIYTKQNANPSQDCTLCRLLDSPTALDCG